VISQVPQQNSIEALGRVVQVLPGPAEGNTLAAVSGHAKKHVADVEPPDPVGQEANVLTTHGPHVQHLYLLAPLEGFDEEAKHIAGVVGWVALKVTTFPGTVG
jgi:hypothetical protein